MFVEGHVYNISKIYQNWRQEIWSVCTVMGLVSSQWKCGSDRQWLKRLVRLNLYIVFSSFGLMTTGDKTKCQNGGVLRLFCIKLLLVEITKGAPLHCFKNNAILPLITVYRRRGRGKPDMARNLSGLILPYMDINISGHYQIYTVVFLVCTVRRIAF